MARMLGGIANFQSQIDTEQIWRHFYVFFLVGLWHVVTSVQERFQAISEACQTHTCDSTSYTTFQFDAYLMHHDA